MKRSLPSKTQFDEIKDNEGIDEQQICLPLFIDVQDTEEESSSDNEDVTHVDFTQNPLLEIESFNKTRVGDGSDNVVALQPQAKKRKKSEFTFSSPATKWSAVQSSSYAKNRAEEFHFLLQQLAPEIVVFHIFPFFELPLYRYFPKYFKARPQSQESSVEKEKQTYCHYICEEPLMCFGYFKFDTKRNIYAIMQHMEFSECPCFVKNDKDYFYIRNYTALIESGLVIPNCMKSKKGLKTSRVTVENCLVDHGLLCDILDRTQHHVKSLKLHSLMHATVAMNALQKSSKEAEIGGQLACLKLLEQYSFPKLKTLELGDIFPRTALSEFIKTKATKLPPSLTSLHFTQCQIPDRFCMELVLPLPNLRVLNIESSNLTMNFFENLRLPNLREIYLPMLTSSLVSQMRQNLPQLQSIHTVAVEESCLSRLFTSEFSQIQELSITKDLNYDYLEENVLKQLKQWTNLRKLSVVIRRLDAVTALTQNIPNGVKCLQVLTKYFTFDVMLQLMKVASLERLTTLNFNSPKVFDNTDWAKIDLSTSSVMNLIGSIFSGYDYPSFPSSLSTSCTRTPADQLNPPGPILGRHHSIYAFKASLSRQAFRLLLDKRFSPFPFLRELELCNLEAFIPSELPVHEYLERLIIEDCETFEQGIKWSEMIPTKFPKLKELRICNLAVEDLEDRDALLTLPQLTEMQLNYTEKEFVSFGYWSRDS